MCVHKAWNLKYETTEMTAATNEDCIGRLLEIKWLLGLLKLLFDGEEIKLLTAEDLFY